jgi:hypothetical protein
VQRFPLRHSIWTTIFLGPFGAARPVAELDDIQLRVRMGLMGSGTIPLERVESVGTMRWPWWAGIGVRIARGTTAFVASSGRAAVLGLSEPVAVRTPLRWKTRRVAVAAEDVDGLVEAIASARGGAVRDAGHQD